jgi:hypothetical protein
VKLRVLEPVARERPTLRDERGMSVIHVEAGAWVRSRRGGGYVHSVAKLHIFRHLPEKRGRERVSHIWVEFRCHGSNYDDRLVEVPNAAIDYAFHREKFCRRCVAKVLGQ